MSCSEVQMVNGQPTILVDGIPYPLMAMTTELRKPDYIRELGKSGMRLFFVMANTSWLQPGGQAEKTLSGWEQFCEDVTLLLQEVPQARIMVRIGLHPPVDWVEKHPNEMMEYQDGSHKPAILWSEIHRQRLPGMYSLCSEAWRSDGAQALRDFCNAVEKKPFADRVIGYFLAAGGTSEWYPINPLEDWENGLYGDCSAPFRNEYERILRKKYSNVQALRDAWKRPEACFENPPIPSLDKRRYINIDDEIRSALQNYECADRQLEHGAELNPLDKGNLGVFLNADKNPEVADFYHAWHQATANTIIQFASVIKKSYPGKLVGAFYGSYGCTDYYACSTAQATLSILDSGVVDFLAAPGVYTNRQPGGYVAQREMQDSFRLRKQIFVSEEDSRTHLEDDFYRDSMQLYDLQDSLNTLKRDYARNLCEETFAWWFDQHPGGGRYQQSEIYQLFKRQQELSQAALNFPRVKRNEIALIYDQESLHYVSIETNRLMLDYYRSTELARIGAPVDYYFHNDLARADMPDYKMYVMVNLFCLTDTEREAIWRKAVRNGATVVWLYAPGFIHPNRSVRMDNQYITELTGFNIGRIDDTVSPKFSIPKNHPALRYGNVDRLYGYLDRVLQSNVWVGSLSVPTYANPLFYIDDSNAEVLGRYRINGKTAMAMKRYRGFCSVYCAAHVLRAELLASLAEYSGCHLFLKGDDCLYANENFVAIHALTTGMKVIRFKRQCNPYEVYEKRFYGNATQEIQLEMRKGETKMFCIADGLPSEGI